MVMDIHKNAFHVLVLWYLCCHLKYLKVYVDETRFYLFITNFYHSYWAEDPITLENTRECQCTLHSLLKCPRNDVNCNSTKTVRFTASIRSLWIIQLLTSYVQVFCKPYRCFPTSLPIENYGTKATVIIGSI